jgi:hypothetical protein
MNRTVVGASLAVALLVGGVIVAEGPVSGPQLGGNATPSPFNPLHANGPDAGKKVCLV